MKFSGVCAEPANSCFHVVNRSGEHRFSCDSVFHGGSGETTPGECYGGRSVATVRPTDPTATMDEDYQGKSFLVLCFGQVEVENHSAFAPMRVDKVLMNAKAVHSRPGRKLDRCGILPGVVLAHFRQVLGLQIVLHMRRGLLMTLLRPNKETLFVSPEINCGCLGIGNRQREAIGIRRFLGNRCVVHAKANPANSRMTWCFAIIRIFMVFAPRSKGTSQITGSRLVIFPLIMPGFATPEHFFCDPTWLRGTPTFLDNIYGSIESWQISSNALPSGSWKNIARAFIAGKSENDRAMPSSPSRFT